MSAIDSVPARNISLVKVYFEILKFRAFKTHHLGIVRPIVQEFKSSIAHAFRGLSQVPSVYRDLK